MTWILIGIGMLLAALMVQIWLFRRRVEEQNNEWTDYLKAMGDLLEDVHDWMRGR